MKPLVEKAAATFALTFLLTACAAPAKLPELPAARANDRVLIIAPHIDDEAIGAAGYLSTAVRTGAHVSVIYLTAGDDNFLSTAIEDRTVWPGASDFLREGSSRIAEGRRAMDLLGVRSVFFLGYPDRGLEQMVHNPKEIIESRGTRLRQVPYPEAMSPGAEYKLENLLRDARRVIALTRPTVIVTSVEFDRHPDHRAAGTIGRILAEEIRPQPRLLMYLVHAEDFPAPYLLARGHPLLPPRQFRDHAWGVYPLSSADEQLKSRVLAAYVTQWDDPDVRALMDTFIRRNELFLSPPADVAVGAGATASSR
jgi:LmbE family N-acetylglucosaminyl deacetylase